MTPKEYIKTYYHNRNSKDNHTNPEISAMREKQRHYTYGGAWLGVGVTHTLFLVI